MATPDHTPKGRGYDSSLIYFHHANDYWTQLDGGECKPNPAKNLSLPIVDFWSENGPGNTLNNSWTCSQSNQAPGCVYEDEIFVEAVLAFIAAHDVSQPFFLFWAPHIAHEPLEVPQAFLDKFAFIDTRPRQFYAAMINYVDTLIGRVVNALKAKGMWDDLLWISSADNGGPSEPFQCVRALFFFHSFHVSRPHSLSTPPLTRAQSLQQWGGWCK